MGEIYCKGKIVKLFSHKIFRYIFVGGISTMIHMGISAFYIAKIDDTLFMANLLGFLISYVFSYTAQSKMVFGHTLSIEKAIKYFIVQFASLLLSVFISEITSDYNNYFKTVIVIGMMPIMTFFMHKLWTFRTV